MTYPVNKHVSLIKAYLPPAFSPSLVIPSTASLAFEVPWKNKGHSLVFPERWSSQLVSPLSYLSLTLSA
jgi:hypothetical protein